MRCINSPDGYVEIKTPRKFMVWFPANKGMKLTDMQKYLKEHTDIVEGLDIAYATPHDKPGVGFYHEIQ